jgi:hypothetical protein
MNGGWTWIQHPKRKFVSNADAMALKSKTGKTLIYFNPAL